MPAPIKKFSDKEIEDIKAMIERDHTHAKRERSDWEKRLPEWRILYEGITTEKQFPWPKAANVFLTMIGDEVDEFVARTMSTLFGDQKWAPAVPVEGFDEERWPKVENFMQWALQSEMKAYGDFHAIIHNTAVDGVCFVFVNWHRQVRTLRRITYQPNYLVIMGQADRSHRPSDAQVLEREFGDLLQSSTKPRGSGPWKIRLLEDGREHDARVWITRDPKNHVGEIEIEIEREEIVYDAPCLNVLNPTAVYTTDTGDIQTAPFVIIQRKVTIDWLARRKAEGRLSLLDEKNWEAIKQNQREMKVERSPQTEHEREKDESTGVDTTTQASHERENWLCFYRYDINDDGFEEEVIFEYDPILHILMGVDYLDRSYPHGRRPVVVFKFQHIPNRLYGQSLAEMVKHFQLTLNTLLNQAIDSQTLRNKPFFFYDKSGDLDDREEVLEISPGRGIGVVGPPSEKILFPPLGTGPDNLVPFVQMLGDFMDRRVGRFSITDATRGRGNAGSFPRTFGGTNVILMEGLIRMENYVRLLAMGGQGHTSGFNELFHQVYDLYAVMMPEKKRFRIMGTNEPAEITREDLRMRPDFMFSVNMLASNPSVRRADALLLSQTFGPQLLQFQALQQWVALYRRTLMAFGVNNIEELIPAIPEMLKHAPTDPMVEEGIMIQGIPWETLPTDDDGLHIQVHNEFKETHLNKFMPEVWMNHDQHVAQHIQQMESKLQPAQGTMQGGGRPMGTERRIPGQPRQPRAPGGELLS